jgi:prevent-host-death family protein
MNNIIDNTVSLKDFRLNLSEVFSRVAYGGERINITKNGKSQAVLIDKDDLKLLEAIEMEADTKAYKKALREDNGKRISLDSLLKELGASRENL